MKNIQKLDLSHCQSSVELSLKEAVALGFKGEFDTETSQGTLKRNGIEVAFSVGSENLYFTIENVYVKESPAEGLRALTEFLNVMSNFGGQG